MTYLQEPPETAYTAEYIKMKRARDAEPKQPEPEPTKPPAATDGLVVHVLASGSKGNATVIESPTGLILIDCGICKRDFFERCEGDGIDPSAIRDILITHEHSDHTKGMGVALRALAKMGAHPRLHVSEAAFANSRALREVEPLVDRRPLVAGESYSIAGMDVDVFSTSHDAADPIGFGISWSDGTHSDSIGYITDSGYLTPGAREGLAGRRLLALESNHDSHLLKIGPYPGALKRRVAGDEGHLSNEQAASALEVLLHDGLEQVVAMHISENNNLPQYPEQVLSEVLKRNGLPAQVKVARQRRTVSIY